MKLKPLVASMALLASGAALAAGFTAPEPVPMVVDRLELQRNHNGRFDQPNDWFRRITLSGEFTVDAGWSDRMNVTNFSEDTTNPTPTRFGAGATTDLALTNANIYLGAQVNEWMMGNIDLQFNNQYNGGLNFRPSFFTVDQDVTNGTIDEGYLTIGNFRQSPVYLLVGKEYVPYGYYTRRPLVAPFTQLMTQTNATAAQIGLVDASGFNMSAFIFRNTVQHQTSGSYMTGTVENPHIENGGAQIGYRYDNRDMGINADVSWLANINDVDYLAGDYIPGIFLGSSIGFTELKSVSGAAATLQGHYMGFDGQLQYTSALRNFNVNQMGYNGMGAKPASWFAGIGYAFPIMDHNSRIGINYQGTKKALAFGSFAGLPGLPKTRWQADYTVNVLKNTDVTVAYYWDKDYGSATTGSFMNADGTTTTITGTGFKKNTAVVRLAARFA